MPTFRLKQTQVEALQVPANSKVILDGQELEPYAWLVVWRGKLSTFTAEQFQEDFEPEPADSPPMPTRRGTANRQKRMMPFSGDDLKRVDPEPQRANKTLAQIVLEAIHSQAMTKQDILRYIIAKGKTTTDGSLYQVIRGLTKQGQIIFDSERSVYRIPISAAKRVGA